MPVLKYLQETLRIVDPLYGWLRPMDEIQPYRLEMATKNILIADSGNNADGTFHCNSTPDGNNDVDSNDHDDTATNTNKSKSTTNKKTKTKSSNNSKDKKTIKLHEYWKPSIQAAIHNETAGIEGRVDGQDDTKERNSLVIVNLASEEYSIAVDHSPMIHVVFRDEGRVIGIHAKRARGLMVRYCAKNHVQSVSQLQQFNEEGYRYQPQQSNSSSMVFNRSKNWNTNS